ncbi:glutamine synthetase [Streptomyces rectiverticillatus]|uniref:glutamine synthetase family protein n=1 Tax=Streptomyces rectiverticillatus TaxID=173860 RepID=UPI0015C2E397|nr:glutamine synthetase [Streptomyces rectiverticillatus]QLE75618.1 glutamine synthetase [Streptomyces rectiverticillatus]
MTVTSVHSELEEHREENTRQDLVQRVKEKLRDTGVEFIHYQAVTLSGRVVGKLGCARHLAQNVENGVRLHPALMADARVDRNGNLLGVSPEDPECVAMPDLDSFGVFPWDPSTGFFFCRLYHHTRLASERAGRLLATDARSNLKRVHAGFTARTGLHLRSGCESEVTWSDVSPKPHHQPGGPTTLLHLESLKDYQEVYQRVIRYGHALGLDMTEGNGDEPGQLELNWQYDQAELTADRLILHRQICRQVARELGCKVSFMPKPAPDHLGNGCHHNISLWAGDRNTFIDPDLSHLHLTETGRHALGGILTHTAAASAIMAPTVNSYKRYWHTGQFAPMQADWGLDNKTCAVRLPDIGRLEVKTPDAMVNPYLSHAVLIAAIEDGLVHQIDPGPPQDAERASDRFSPLPLSLSEALDQFIAAPLLIQALGPELARLYHSFRSEEWMRFCGAVTDWEHLTYSQEGC